MKIAEPLLLAEEEPMVWASTFRSQREHRCQKSPAQVRLARKPSTSCPRMVSTRRRLMTSQKGQGLFSCFSGSAHETEKIGR